MYTGQNGYTETSGYQKYTEYEFSLSPVSFDVTPRFLGLTWPRSRGMVNSDAPKRRDHILCPTRMPPMRPRHLQTFRKHLATRTRYRMKINSSKVLEMPQSHQVRATRVPHTEGPRISAAKNFPVSNIALAMLGRGGQQVTRLVTRLKYLVALRLIRIHMAGVM